MLTIYITLLAYLISSIGLYGVFRKVNASKPGYYTAPNPILAFIPFYNYYIWLKIVKSPWWWIFLLMIPSVNYIMFGIMSYQLARTFKRTGFVEILFAVILVPFYLVYLGYGKTMKFYGPPDLSKVKPSASKEWVDAIIFAVVVATIVRTFFIEAFTIPTSSLEKTLLVGDYLFVSKMSYGAKMPNTPIAFPFAHHTMPLTKSLKSYFEFIKLPYMRLPGFGKVQRNDLVVFNYPDGDTVAENFQDRSYYQLLRDEAEFFRMMDFQNRVPRKSDKEYMAKAWSYAQNPIAKLHVRTQDGSFRPGPIPFGKIIPRPPDKRENYVKRCVAIAGDVLEIKNGKLLVNGNQGYQSAKLQHIHEVILKSDYNNEITEELLDQTDVYTESFLGSSVDETTKKYRMILHMSDEIAEKFRRFSFVEVVRPLYDRPGEYDPSIFPHSRTIPWNKDNFGPFTLPKKGVTVSLDTSNIVFYDRIITAYELNTLEVREGKIFINGIQTSSYTFAMDYFFMMGDNRHNSADSRSWGLVPEDHIVGSPVFVWMSIKDPEKNPVSGKMKFKNIFAKDGKFRWERFFSFVGNEGVSRSYFIHFLVIMGLIYTYAKVKKRFIKKKK